MSLDPIASLAPASTGAAPAPASLGPEARTPPPNAVIDTVVTPVSPPGYTETVTTQADGAITSVITNAAGAVVETTLAIATMSGPGVTVSGSSVSVWA